MPELTRREREVLDRVCRGLASKTIAAELGVSEQAVKAHISRLFLKFGVANRAGLVGAAISGTERGSGAAERHGHAAELERRIVTLTARNAELEREGRSADLERQVVRLTARNAELEDANRGLRGRLDDPPEPAAAD